MTTRDQGSGKRPTSDVSAAVGLTGVAGLSLWIAVCHFWPEIGAAFDLPGPRARLVGPYAALLGLIFAALPMIVWSLAVDKVHRRPSTGIDWSLRRPVSDVIDITVTKLAGLWATWAIIAALYCVCRWYWAEPYLIAMDVLGTLAVPLFLISVPYVLWLDRRLVEPRDACWHFGALLIGREGHDSRQVWIHLRAWAVKGFFTAFMISIVPGGFANLVAPDWATMMITPVGLASLLITVMFVLDEQIGTVGYVLTMKPLDAHIRSANQYLAGWLAALLCYPPFQIMGQGRPVYYTAGTDGDNNWIRLLGSHDTLMWAWAALLVFLTAIYAWATFAFGIRFSNLTYRGVLTNGPYAWSRHPAYLSKNLFWWCTTLPFFVSNGSFTDAVRNTFFLGVVSAIYYWRARTEEKHLLAEDPKYTEYWQWMQQHGLITAPLARLGAVLKDRRPTPQSVSSPPSS